MKVGELARRTGVSVRTLHHYDEIGLLPPAGRTPSGHRLYGPAQVRRLQQIASLRQVGLSLEEIGELLGAGGLTLDQALEAQLGRLREEIRRQGRLVKLLEELRARLGGPDEPSLDDLARTIAATLRQERYYTAEQLRTLAGRRKAVGAGRMEEAQEEWREVLGAFTAAMEEGLDPASPRVQALARRARALVEEFTGGDPGIRSSLARMYREEGGAAVVGVHGMETAPGLWAYMERARGALASQDPNGGGGSASPS